MTDMPQSPGFIAPPECGLPGCDETAQSILEPHCSTEHERACRVAASEVMFGDVGFNDYDELARQKAKAYENAPDRTPEEMQRVINQLREREE